MNRTKTFFLQSSRRQVSRRYLFSFSSATCQSDVSGPVNAPALTTDSSRYWRNFIDEQTSHRGLYLKNDLVSGNIISKERTRLATLKEDARSKKLSLMTGNEDAEEEIKCKQRLTDKVRKEVRRMKQGKQRRKYKLVWERI